MTDKERELVQHAIPQCTTLEMAERACGAGFSSEKGLTSFRVKVWGWFDGWHGRVFVPPNNLQHKDFYRLYQTAYHEGQDLAMREQPA